MTGETILIRSSAPGKLMLFGEHAVLYGYPCLVAAVTPRAHVRLQTRCDDTVTIQSELGDYRTSLESLVVEEPFTFVLEAIRTLQPQSGFDLTIACEFPADVGLGSSAAVTVAVVGALAAMKTGGTSDKDAIFRAALDVVRTVQGTGSGADLAASTYGGVIYMKSGGEALRTLDCCPEIYAVYSGAKEKTADVIAKVKDAYNVNPSRFDDIFHNIGTVVESAEHALTSNDWPELGRLMDINQGLMDALGVNNKALSDIIVALRNEPGIYGAKISGSGLGDCAIGLGTLSEQSPVTPLDLRIDSDGLRIV